jgi:hypothetical protein
MKILQYPFYKKIATKQDLMSPRHSGVRQLKMRSGATLILEPDWDGAIWSRSHFSWAVHTQEGSGVQGALEEPSLFGRGISFRNTCRLSGLEAHKRWHAPGVHPNFVPYHGDGGRDVTWPPRAETSRCKYHKKQARYKHVCTHALTDHACTYKQGGYAGNQCPRDVVYIYVHVHRGHYSNPALTKCQVVCRVFFIGHLAECQIKKAR